LRDWRGFRAIPTIACGAMEWRGLAKK
jgi:hypothetical protein